MRVNEKAPAKLNLSLDTPMRYFDGSPRWDMVMTSADLADYVTVETHRRPTTIKVYTDSGFLPSETLLTRQPIFSRAGFTVARV